MEQQRLEVLKKLNKLQQHLLSYEKRFVTDRYMKGLRSTTNTVINELQEFIEKATHESHSED